MIDLPEMLQYDHIHDQELVTNYITMSDFVYHEILLCNLVPYNLFCFVQRFWYSCQVMKIFPSKYWYKNRRHFIVYILNYKYMHIKWLYLIDHISLYNDQGGDDYDVLVIIIVWGFFSHHCWAKSTNDWLILPHVGPARKSFNIG